MKRKNAELDARRREAEQRATALAAQRAGAGAGHAPRVAVAAAAPSLASSSLPSSSQGLKSDDSFGYHGGTEPGFRGDGQDSTVVGWRSQSDLAAHADSLSPSNPTRIPKPKARTGGVSAPKVRVRNSVDAKGSCAVLLSPLWVPFRFFGGFLSQFEPGAGCPPPVTTCSPIAFRPCLQ